MIDKKFGEAEAILQNAAELIKKSEAPTEAALQASHSQYAATRVPTMRWQAAWLTWASCPIPKRRSRWLTACMPSRKPTKGQSTRICCLLTMRNRQLFFARSRDKVRDDIDYSWPASRNT